jgi:hypothetical protein
MSLGEAVACAVKLEFLLPPLRSGFIAARHGGLYSPDGSKPKKAEYDRIPADWWFYVLDIDSVAGRVLFAVDGLFRIPDRDGKITADTLAIGIELERPAVVKMFPAAQQPEQPTRPAEPKMEPKDWLVWARKEYPQPRKQRPTAYIRRLHEEMKTADNVTEVWPFETFRVRYYESVKADKAGQQTVQKARKFPRTV